MIWQLVKRDPAWRRALISMAVSAVASLALPRQLMGVFAFLAVMPWLQSRPHERATLFQAALPIRACDLFLARILALLAGVWLPVAAAAALLLLTGRPTDAVILMEVGAAVSAVVLAAQSSRVRELAGSQWAPAISWAIVCAAAYPVWRFVPPPAVVGTCALLCAALFWNIWRQLPPAFEVLPSTLTPQVSRQGNTVAPAFVWWPIPRSLFLPRTLGFLPMIVMGSISGQWPFVSIFCTLPVLIALSGLSWVLSLPVRRGVVLAAVLLPWVGVLLLGDLARNWYGDAAPIRLEWSASNRISGVRAPLEFWRTGKAPIIQAPWGESWQPATIRLLGVAIYNPYSVGPANTTRFFEWQFRRATEAVYGEAIDYADFKRFRPRVRPLMRQARLAILNLSACACWVMLLVILFFTSLHWRVQRVVGHGQSAVIWLLVAQTGCVVLIDMAAPRLPSPVTVSLVDALLQRVSSLLPASLPAVALAAVLPVALLCWTAVQLFRGVEIPTPAAAARS